MAACAVLLPMPPAFAQSAFALRGTVSEPAPGLPDDADGGPLPTAAAAAPTARPPARQPAAGEEPQAAAPRAARLTNEDDAASERENLPEEPVGGRKRQRETEPFAAPGIAAGRFVLRPSLESGLAATSNAVAGPGGRSAVLSESTLRVGATADWGGNTLAIDADAAFRRSLSGMRVSEPSAGIDGRLAVDLGADFTAIAAFGYRLQPEAASSPGAVAGAVNEPLTQRLAGSLGVEKESGKLRLRALANVERLAYGDARLAGGTVVSQRDRDSTLLSAALRAGYQVAPAWAPFVEVEAGRRRFDLAADSAGYRRSADRLAARLGTTLDLGEKFGGEVSAGFVRERPDDPRLAAIAGPTIEAALRWSPVRGTSVGLNATTTVEPGTAAGESGSLLHVASLSFERQMRADLIGTLTLGGLYRDYLGSNGRDLGWSAEAGAVYWLNRYVGLVGRLRHEALTSNVPGRDYTADSAFLGVRLQR